MVEKTQMYKEIAPRLFGLRESLGMTHAELAQKISADPELVAGYEKGDREIPVSYLMDVAHACGVNLTELLSGDSFPKISASLRVFVRGRHTTS